jgi:hypothetical protein
MTTLRALTGWRTLNLVLPWLGALVLAAGIATFVVVFFGSDDEPTRAPAAAARQPAANEPAAVQEKPTKRVALPEEARKVAAEFISTAVARKNLARSYALAHPELRQGMTLKQWKTGNIPVQPYPVDTARFKLDYSYPNEAQIEVSLEAKPGARQPAAYFILGLRKYRRHWTVDYWGPRGGVPVPRAD